MLALLAAIALSPNVQAQDCDAKQLKKDVTEASPMGLPGAYTKLAECDPKAADALTSDVFSRALVGNEGNQILQTAISIDADTLARDWVNGLQSDERSRTIAALGDACGKGNEKVGVFLAETEKALGDAFWTERWYRSLAQCRTPEVQELLRKEVQNPSADRTRFFGVLEVFCRNLGKDSVPYLKSLLITIKDAEELTYIVNAFADAARVGSMEGQDADATAEAVKAIIEMAPQLPARAVEQARTTLVTLGAQAEADALAAVRYADRLDASSQLHYGVVVLEETTCKKGNSWLGVHHGELIEGGGMWPDQVAAAIEGASLSWSYPQAKKCKGTSSNTVLLAPSPQTEEQMKAWRDEQRQDIKKRKADKTTEYDEETALSL